ncbi:hypothetical protein B296_00039309 [Ensete ventricosum]|uniref:Uncharacterized protein n=1 Tax=Ensete ventricosum TaxID=4639 RepID=A0A426ZTP4_ENSVE|nr:hypothetical protein B296_00039309 [Ensete ventricosum]
MESRTSMVSRKNTTVINFTQSPVQSRVSIDFSCTVLEIQNTNHSQRISPWVVVRARVAKKCDGHKLCVNSEPSTNRSAVAIVSPPRGRPAPRGEEAATLPPLKSLIAEVIAILTRLESPIAEATAILPHLNSPRTIVEEKLPSATPSSFGKERGCYPQHRSQA